MSASGTSTADLRNTGAITFTATATNTARADSDVFSGSLVAGIGISEPTAIIDGDTSATFDGDVTTSAGAHRSGDSHEQRHGHPRCALLRHRGCEQRVRDRLRSVPRLWPGSAAARTSRCRPAL